MGRIYRAWPGYPVFSSHAVALKNLKMASGRSRKVVTDDDDMSKIEFETSEDVDVIPTFDSMRLREDLVRGIYAYGKVTNLMQFVWNQVDAML